MKEIHAKHNLAHSLKNVSTKLQTNNYFSNNWNLTCNLFNHFSIDLSLEPNLEELFFHNVLNWAYSPCNYFSSFTVLKLW